MGVAKPVVLPSFTFPTKAAALEAVRKILYGYELEGVVTDPEHDLLLRELLTRHPQRAEKEQGGIKEFFIRLTSKGDRQRVKKDARGIWIRPLTGPPKDFSFYEAVNTPGPWADLSDALRVSIDPKRVEFREARIKNGPAHDDITGEVITDWNQAEVRYVSPTWAQLVDGFVAEHGPVNHHSGHGEVRIGGQLDAADAEAWHKYWVQHARPVLRLKPSARQRGSQ